MTFRFNNENTGEWWTQNLSVLEYILLLLFKTYSSTIYSDYTQNKTMQFVQQKGNKLYLRHIK